MILKSFWKTKNKKQNQLLIFCKVLSRQLGRIGKSCRLRIKQCCGDFQIFHPLWGLTHITFPNLWFLCSSILERGCNWCGDLLSRFSFEELSVLVDGYDIGKQSSAVSPFKDCLTAHLTQSQVLLVTTHMQWRWQQGPNGLAISSQYDMILMGYFSFRAMLELANTVVWACCVARPLFLSTWCLLSSSSCVHPKTPSHKTSINKLCPQIISGESPYHQQLILFIYFNLSVCGDLMAVK